MEQNTELAARLARLDARRQATARPAATPGTSTAPGARRRRPHAARRSRIGVTIGSAMAMVGLTGAMALADQTASAADTVTTDVAVSQTAAATAAASTNSTAVATTVTAAAPVTPTTVAVTQSNGS